ncbi:MAG: FtsW/RodA/SpoVE family cell cycle protein [Armatimonadota bacterium]
MSDSQRNKDDKLLAWAVLALVVVGLIVVYDASFPSSGFWQIIKQSAWALVGLFAYMVGRRLSLITLYRWVPALAIVTLMMMLATYHSPLGIERGGAHRWLRLGQIGPVEITLQPAEFGKIVLIMLLARLLCHSNLVSACKPIQDRPLPWLLAILSVLVASGVVVGVQKDLGTALVFVGIGVAMLFIAGLPFRWVATLVAVLTIAGVLLIFHEQYRWQRVVAFTQPFAYMNTIGYQLAHSLMGIGTGGVWGAGLGLGRAKEFLPAAETDFVFATVAEETGALGSTAIIALLVLVLWRMFLIAHKTQTMFLLLLVSGTGTMIALQSLLNLYVVTGSVPTTGVPLPFISYGGSSLVSLLFSIGLAQKAASDPMLEHVKGASHARAARGRGHGRTLVSRREYRRGVA